METALTSVREDLVETLNAWVVKTISSQMVKLYNPAKEPTLVFFRHGVPLLYDGMLFIISVLMLASFVLESMYLIKTGVYAY